MMGVQGSGGSSKTVKIQGSGGSSKMMDYQGSGGISGPLENSGLAPPFFRPQASLEYLHTCRGDGVHVQFTCMCRVQQW